MKTESKPQEDYKSHIARFVKRLPFYQRASVENKGVGVEKRRIYLNLLKIILWIYIILCFIIAGLNYGYAAKAPPVVAKIIMWVWLIYENWIKTLFIIICSFLTIRILGDKKNGMKKRNLIGFIAAALIVHVAAPIMAGNFDLYFYAMPLPWTTTPLQLLDPKSALYKSTVLSWGYWGLSAALVFFICISIIVLIGTLLFGRRFQCSTICLFNGFAAEVFEPAIPLIGKRKKPKKSTVKFLDALRWVFLSVSLFFMMYWCLYLIGVTLPGNIDVITKLESYKYLTGELLMTIFFWIAFVGRGYCYFCPLGTVLGLLSKLSNQKISTNHTKCVQCGKCNDACPMSIEIKNCAAHGEDVRNLRCVGCGRCMDACPTGNLGYSTWVISQIHKKGSKTGDLSQACRTRRKGINW